MRYAVCVKQVPVISQLEFDPRTRTLRREGVPSEVSAFDVRALIKAIELRDQTGGEVVVLTMGPPQAKEALYFCLALGADRAIHLCDPGFAGSDTLATSRALALALRREAPDVILLGRYSVDAETSQVGPQVAELLDLPQITAVHMVQIDIDNHAIEAERETDDGYERVRAQLPVVVTAAEDLAVERFPKRSDREAAINKPLTTLSIADLNGNLGELGMKGSPTWVSDIRSVETHRLGKVLDAPLADAVATLASILVDKYGLFANWSLPESNSLPTAAIHQVKRPFSTDLWCVSEVRQNGIRSVSLEIIGKLRELADRTDGTVTTIVLDECNSVQLARLAAAGADRVLVAPDGAAQSNVAAATSILSQAIAVHNPGVVVFPATTFGRDVAPRLAARLALGLTSDCIDLDWDDSGRLLQFKPAFGGTIVAPILSRTQPELATVRPGVFPKSESTPGIGNFIGSLPIAERERPHLRVDTIERRTVVDSGSDLDNAEIVVGIGRGVGGRDGISRITPLVEVLGASLCATRDVTDLGWMPRQYQVGLTGRSISPKLYIGLGIRGAFEHMVGLRRAGIIVAINKSPRAPIFKNADYGIVGEVDHIIPDLTRRLAALRTQAR